METAASSPVTAVADGVRLRLRVQPRARRNRVDGLVADADGKQALKIAVTAAPEDRARRMTLSSRCWPRNCIWPNRRWRWLPGPTDRRKIIKLAGDPQRLARDSRGMDREIGKQGMSDNKIIDGKAFAEKLRGRIAQQVAALKSTAWLHAGPGGGAGGRGSRQQGLCEQQGPADRRSRHELVRAQAAGHDIAGGAAGAGRQAQQGRGGERHPGPAAAAQADRSPGDPRCHRSGQGCGRLPCRQCRAARHRRQRPGALHAAGLSHAAEGSPRRSHRQARHRRRPLQHRRQADGAAAAERKLHRDHRPFAAPAISRANAAAPISSSPPWAGPRWCAATGSRQARW